MIAVIGFLIMISPLIIMLFSDALWFDEVIVGGLMFGGFIIMLIGISMLPPDPRVEECKAKGGIWLSEVRSSGKTRTEHSIGCIKPDAFIQLENK